MKHSIPYKQIDKKCINLVKYFNSIGLITEFSCEGHPGERSEFYIIFSKEVSDKQISNFINKFPETLGSFMKWLRVVRTNTCPQGNWMYLIINNTPKNNHEWAKRDLETFLKVTNSKK